MAFHFVPLSNLTVIRANEKSRRQPTAKQQRRYSGLHAAAPLQLSGVKCVHFSRENKVTHRATFHKSLASLVRVSAIVCTALMPSSLQLNLLYIHKGSPGGRKIL